MPAQDAAARHSGDVTQIGEPATAHLMDGGGGTLIVDALGRICACTVAAEHLFGASRSRLIGTQVSELVAGIFPRESTPLCNAGSLESLCENGDWRRFEARDAQRHGFAVEIHVSRRAANGQEEMFVLSLRQPGDAP
jgi:hypothetical protein